MVQHQEGTFVGVGDLPLYYQSWHSGGGDRAVLVLVHGLGGHSGAFQRLVQYFVARGYGVYGFDWRGHGRSPGQRAYVERWSDYRQDLQRLIQGVRSQMAPSTPCFLLGHSLGGLLVLDYSLHYPEMIQGVISMAPALRQVGVSPLRLLLGRILSRIYPRFSLNTGISIETASRDPQVVEAYRRDPLRHSRGTARLATEFEGAMAWVWQHAAELQVPLLLMHGQGDRVTDYGASQALFEQIPLVNKQWLGYPENYHHLYDDLNTLEIFADLERWLEKQQIAISGPSKI
jgi:alpha-beta hydrolase superfamily lysophospholipase